MSEREKYLAPASSEFQKVILLAEKYITRRADTNQRDPQAVQIEDAIVQTTRDCLIQILNVVRSQYCMCVPEIPLAAQVAILLKATADLMFGLDMNPFFRQHKTHLVLPMQMAMNSAYDAIEGGAVGDRDMIARFAWMCGDLAASIVNLHAGFNYLRDVSIQLKKDVADIYG